MTDRRLKVLVKINDLILGGCQLNALDFALEARRHGVDTTLVGYRETLPHRGPSMIDIAAERGVALEVLDAGPREGWRNRRRRARELSALADRLDVDLVHTYGAWTARQAFWGPCKFAKRPLVQTVYEMYVPSTVYRRVPLVVGTRYLLTELRDTRGRVWLISPPVDLQRDAPGAGAGTSTSPELAASSPNGELRIVIVSRLDDDMKAHGISIVMRSLLRMERDDVVFVVVGGGDAEERLEAEGAAVNEQLGRPAVVFTGPLGDPRAAYDAADVMLGMGGSAARSLAFAKPLVVVGERGWSQRFSEETADFLFSQSFWSFEDVDDDRAQQLLIDQIAPLLDEADERARMAEFGRAFAEEHFGLEAMTERLVAIYDEAMVSYDRTDWIADWRTEIANALGLLTWRLRGRPDTNPLG